MDVKLDTDSKKPKYIVLRDELRRMILSGELPTDAKLPSQRALMVMAGVSRNTVMEAYGLLEDDGLVEVVPGKGVFVQNGLAVPRRDDGRCFDWAVRINEDIARLTDYREHSGKINYGDRSVISFSSLAPDHNLFAAEVFRKALNDIMAREGSILLNYGYVRGFEPLRRYLLDYLKSKGINHEGHELLITNGFRQGLELIARVLVKKGDTVLCEGPTYNGALGVFYSVGANIVAVDMDEEGMRADLAEQAIRQHHPAFIYVIPTYQNPTGINMSTARRRQLLELARKYSVPIVEDGFNEELRFYGAAMASIKSMDTGGFVVYAGSFSKVLFPGLRVGWVLAPKELGRHLYHGKYNDDIHTGLLHQAGLYEYLSRGNFEKHLRYCRSVYKSRMAAALSALSANMRDLAEWSESSGGFCVWLKLKNNVNARTLLDKAVNYGVMYVPGDTFYPDGRGADHIRLGFSRLDEKSIGEGIARLARLVRTEG